MNPLYGSLLNVFDILKIVQKWPIFETDFTDRKKDRFRPFFEAILYLRFNGDVGSKATFVVDPPGKSGIFLESVKLRFATLRVFLKSTFGDFENHQNGNFDFGWLKSGPGPGPR